MTHTVNVYDAKTGKLHLSVNCRTYEKALDTINAWRGNQWRTEYIGTGK